MTTPPQPKTVRWADLQRNDTIWCPAARRHELVVAEPQRRPDGRVFVRTNRHDHHAIADDTVSVWR